MIDFLFLFCLFEIASFENGLEEKRLQKAVFNQFPVDTETQENDAVPMPGLMWRRNSLKVKHVEHIKYTTIAHLLA